MNQCAFTMPGGPECGTVLEHFPPTPLAARLCANALANLSRFEAANDNEWKLGRRLTRQAWGHVEMSHGLPMDDASAEEHFENAQVLIDQARGVFLAETDRPDIEGYIDLRLLNIYLPTFQRRRAGIAPTDNSRREIRGALVDLADEVESSTAHESIKTGLRNKLALHLILNRRNLDVYPASAREARAQGEQTANAHDAYIFDPAGRKIAIKLRSSILGAVNYAGSQLFLALREIAADTYVEPDGRKKPHAAILAARIVPLLQAEARGERLAPSDVVWLDQIGKNVYAQLGQFIRATRPR